MKKLTYSLLSIVLATTLTACGGSDDNNSKHANSNSHNQQPSTAIGRFIDSAVQGVEVFQSGKSLGKTNKMGQFEYKVNGGELTFKVGQVTLGSTQPKPIVTPIDLATDKSEQTEIMQVLQSLDSDQNPDNGITISETVIKNLNTPMNLTDDKVTPLDVVKKAIPNSHHVVPADAAQAHFAKTQEQLNKEQANTNQNNDSSKPAKLVGYWKSTCLNESSGSSITYHKVTKLDNQRISSQVVEHNYATANCSGSYSTSTKTESHNVTDDKGGQITIVNNNQFTVEYTDHGKPVKEVYNRISEAEYNKVSKKTPEKDTLKTDKMVGYWKSNCFSENNGSRIVYGKITKLDNQHIHSQAIVYNYATANCSGSYSTENITHSHDLTDKQSQQITIVNDNQFTAGEEVYNRISEAEYNKASTTQPTDNSMDKFLGYWKSNCITVNNKSIISYLHATKKDSNYLNNAVINYMYNSNNCTGSYDVERDSDDVSKSELSEVTVLPNGSFRVDNATYNRISADEYPN